MQKRLQETQQFQREYFNKTFKTFFLRKVAQIIEQQQEPEKIFSILDLQANIKHLFFRSCSKQKLERSIKQQLIPFIGVLKGKINSSEVKIRFLKHVLFIQIYVWLLETQIGTRKALSTRQFQSINILFTKFKIQCQFDSIGASQDYFNRIIDQLSSMGRFNYNFKDIICKIAHKNQFQLTCFQQILAIQIEKKANNDQNFKKQLKTENSSVIPQDSNPGKTSITSIQTPGKSSQNRSAKSSPQHSLGRTVFLSHPMRFKAPKKPNIKVITEYYQKQTDSKSQKVQ